MNERLQQYREEAGLSRQELADSIGASLATIMKIESGARKPSIEMLLKIQGVLNMDLHWVLTGDEI